MHQSGIRTDANPGPRDDSRRFPQGGLPNPVVNACVRLCDCFRCEVLVVATPEQTHDEIIRFALAHDQHVMSVKPLVMKHKDAVEI